MARDQAAIEAAEDQIRQQMRVVDYQIREYPVEVIVEKHLVGREEGTNELFVPDYQRDLVWDEKRQSRFIESLLIGLPIPYLFVADVGHEDEELAGRLEIVDGTQRIRTLARFLTDKLVLTELKRLPLLEGFVFSDLAPSRQRRVRRITLRMIELTEQTDEETRRDMFDRINTGSVRLEDMEVRRGRQPGPFIDLVKSLSKDPRFIALAPVSPASEKRFEREELVSRLFAYLDRYRNFGAPGEGKVVGEFIDDYTEHMNRVLSDPQDGAAAKQKLKEEWDKILDFVSRNFPSGFAKKKSSKSTPRVRFEAIGVGVGLALRNDPNLIPKDVTNWLDDDTFRRLTTSDGANNRNKVIGRIEYVRDRLMER